MSNEQLVQQIQSGISAKENLETLYFQNSGLIYQLIQPYKQFEDEADLMQEAYIGLYKACQKYDSSINENFMTYAGFWIRQAVSRYIQNSGSTLRIPVHLQQRIYRIRQFSRAFTSEHGRKPSTEEIAENLGLSTAQVETASIYMQEPKSLNAPLAESQDFECSTLEDVLPDENSDFENDVIEEVFQKELNRDLWKMVEISLSEREADVVRLMFRDNATMADIARQQGCTREYIRQIKERAFKKLNTGRFHRLIREYGECAGFYYRNSLSDFKRHGSLSVERTAIKELGLQESIREEVRKAL